MGHLVGFLGEGQGLIHVPAGDLLVDPRLLLTPWGGGVQLPRTERLLPDKNCKPAPLLPPPMDRYVKKKFKWRSAGGV